MTYFVESTDIDSSGDTELITVSFDDFEEAYEYAKEVNGIIFKATEIINFSKEK
jgi:hypothetical protein